MIILNQESHFEGNFDHFFIHLRVHTLNEVLTILKLHERLLHMDDNPLNKLIVDADVLDKEKLASLIMGNLGISQSGDVIILAGFNSLTTKSKILSLLLARKAAKVMSLATSENASTKDITQKTGLPEGTVGRELFELKKARLITNENGYYVPDYAIHQISIETNHTGTTGIKKTTKKANRTNSSRSEEVKKYGKTDQLLQIKQESIKPELVDLMLKPGLIFERSLAVLQIGRENGIDDLTPAEIETFLKTKIRAGGVWKSNISLYLGKNTKYVDRVPDPAGSGFTYRIMASGDRLLEEALKKDGVLQTAVDQNDEITMASEEKA